VSPIDATLQEGDAASPVVNSEVALIPRGADIPVTLINRAEYIRRRADYRMTQQSRALMIPFLEGFHLTMPIGFLQCFTPEDLELVSCGVSNVDVEDLRAHTTYEGYHMGAQQVRWFWECCATMSQQDLGKLIQFATASTRPPAGGFASLNPPLMLVRCPTSENLPVAHTCMNRIDLPEYESATVLREKLKQALAFGNVGFGLV
jgi:E3 ubiquitin-protein ligase HUWE1